MIICPLKHTQKKEFAPIWNRTIYLYANWLKYVMLVLQQ